MTRKKKRWYKSLGRNKILKITKIRRKVYFVDTPMPITYWSWKQRFFSLFCFKKPTDVICQINS